MVEQNVLMEILKCPLREQAIFSGSGQQQSRPLEHGH